MQVARLWRYPVKSLRGERLEALELDSTGVIGDRAFALVRDDGKIASGKDSQRFRKVPGLLMHASRYDGDDVVLELADGRAVREADAQEVVAELAGPRWRLAREDGVPFKDDAPIHLVTTATLRTLAIEAERVRPNLLLDTPTDEGFPEDGWLDRTLVVGEAILRITHRTERCVMTTHAQADLPHKPYILKAIGRANDTCAGVYAEVVRPGRIRLHDPAELAS